MMTGWKDDAKGSANRRRPGLPGRRVAPLFAAAVVYGASGAWLPPAATTTAGGNTKTGNLE